METKINKSELDILLKADTDLFETGSTKEKCPRCGNDIICIKNANSYSIRCKTDGCIETSFRGI